MVKRILAENGIDTGPRRGEGTWDKFLKLHTASLWQCDFFSQKVSMFQGIRDVFVLAFLNVRTQRVIISPATHQPIEAWVVEQSDSFVKELKLPICLAQHDCDMKLTNGFKETLQQNSVKPIPSPYRVTNTNAYIERFVQSVGNECLVRSVIFGLNQMDHLCQDYLEYYHQEWHHQRITNEL